MGCFNSKGCFSRTPIVYGDKVVAFIGLADNEHARECDEFAPGMSFTPLTLPIHGTYNDYGSVENITRTATVEIVEKFFGKDIDTIFEEVSRHEFKFDSFLKAVEKKDREFYGRCGYEDMYKDYDKRYSFELVMEHEDVFYAMLKTNDIIGDMHSYFYHDDRSINILLGEDYDKDLALIDEYNKAKEEMAEKFAAGLSDDGKEHIKNITDEEYNEIINISARHILREKGLLERKVATFYPENDDLMLFRSVSLTRFGNEVNSSFYMFPFKNVVPTKELKKDSVEFISLMFALSKMCMTWGISNYCNQDARYDETIMVLKATLKLMKKKRKAWNKE